MPHFLHFAYKAYFTGFKQSPAPATALAAALSLFMLLSACSASRVAQTANPPAHDSAPAAIATTPEAGTAARTEAKPDIKYGNFTEDQLTRAILAELAGQRGQNDVALKEYAALARESGNASIAQRAMRIAAFSRDAKTAIEMAELWLKQDPSSVEARQTLAVELISISRFRDAFQQFAQLLDQGETVDFRMLSARIAASASSGSAPMVSGLIEDYEALLKRYPQHETLRLSLAHLYQIDKRPKPALALIQQMLKEVEQRGPNATVGASGINGGDLVMLEVQLLDTLDDRAAVMKRVQQGIRSYPTHKDLRYFYARKLIGDKKFAEARDQFAELIAQYPGDGDLLYSLALISLEINMPDDAKSYLQRLLLTGQRLDDAHYYLGLIDTQQNHNDLAIEHYQKVRSGPNFLQALRNLTQLMVRAGRLDDIHSYLQNIRFRSPELNITLLALEANILIDEKRYEVARTLLDGSVSSYPGSVELLSVRSVLNQNTNDMAMMEADLRKIILLQPQSAMAYNSLGYVLADRTDRIQEAYELIKHAYELSPNDPAIIDSMGWVQYKLGMFQEARDNLDKAYKLFPDAEVAAHLGEVLWMLGEKSAATRLWRGALATQPDNQYIRSTMRRLDPSASL